MASVDDVLSGINDANEKAETAFQAVHQAATSLEDAQQTFVAATEGSTQPEIEEARSHLNQAVRDAEDLQRAIRNIIAANDNYKGRL